MRQVDVAIVGAGPTGLFAAYYAGFRGLSTLVIDALPEPGGQVTALDQSGLEAAHRCVARDAGPRGAAADDEDFGFERGHSYRPQYRSGPGTVPGTGTVPKAGWAPARF